MVLGRLVLAKGAVDERETGLGTVVCGKGDPASDPAEVHGGGERGGGSS